MEQNWTTETTRLLNKVNAETDKLLKENLTIEEFHIRHEKLMKFWDEESKRLKEKYPPLRKTKAIPKNSHLTTHMTDKYVLNKLLNKFYEQ